MRVNKKCGNWFLMASIIGVMLFMQNAGAAAIPVTSVTKDASGVTFAMTPGSMRIDVCTEKIVRVRYSLQNTIPVDPNMSFLVNKTWSSVAFTQTETASDVSIVTSQLQVKVNKTTGAVSFLNAAGTAVLQETATGGKTLTTATINGQSTYTCEQIFDSPADEGIYGLGAWHDNIINYHGIPEYLNQANTHVSTPMMISNKGYGILWANASRTFFNKPDQVINLSNGSGNFTTTTAGEYVFLATGAGMYTFNIKVNGTELNSLNTMWHGDCMGGKITLPANTTVPVSTQGTALYGGPLRNATKFTSRAGQTVDYYYFYGPTPDSVIAGYRLATGTAPLFSKGVYGFIHCKAQYDNQTQILDAASQFRTKKIPIDVIVQDWNYWAGGWNSMVFKSVYPNPRQMITDLHAQNYNFMISVWSKTDGGSVVDKALDPYKYAGSPFFDAFNPQARSVYWTHMNNNLYSLGVDAFWQDANEPEELNLENCNVNFGSGAVGGKLYANAYPLFVCKTVYEGCRSVATTNKRVCLLSRSSFAGNQRYAAINWNGDIGSDWSWYGKSIRAGLNYCMAGMPYWTSDIGGFFRPGNDQTDPGFNELLTRWIQFGAFCPIFRIHGYNTHTEIWNYLQSTQNAFMIYDNLRYRLMPYTYSLAAMVTNSGYTMMRGLVMDFQNDATALNIGDQFMYGPAFLVNPVTVAGATSRSVYLPAGNWTNFWTGEATAGAKTVTARAARDTIPLFIKAGSIVPMGPYLQYATEKNADTIELRVYPGANGSFTLYEDENVNYNYETGKSASIPITYIDNPKNVIIGDRIGTFTGLVEKKVFNVVYVSANHGTGVGNTAQPDCQIVYTGQLKSCNPVGVLPSQLGAAGMIPVNFTARIAGATVSLPASFAGKTKNVAVYNCSGKLLQRAVFKRNNLDVRKDLGLSVGAVYIVKANVVR